MIAAKRMGPQKCCIISDSDIALPLCHESCIAMWPRIGWQQQLCDLLIAVQTKRHQYDQAASACQILLRPWPKKQQEANEAETIKLENKNKTYAEENQLQEEAELKFVNDLLSKAKKTRVKISSKRSEENSKITGKELSSANSEKLQWEVCVSEAASIQETGVNTESFNLIATPKTDTAETACQRSGNVSENLVHDLQKKHHPETQTRKESGATGFAQGHSAGIRKKVPPSVSNLSKSKVVGNTTRSKSVESAQNLRLQSRPGSSRGKMKPAHMTAPFKTDPSLHAPRRQTPKNAVPALIQRMSSKKQTSLDSKCNTNQEQTGNATFQGRALPPISSEASPIVSPDVHLDGVCSTPIPSDREEMTSGGDLSSGEGPNEKLLNSEMSKVTLLDNSVITNKNDSSQSCQPGQSCAAIEEQDADQFSLISDGTSLNIPSKVRRAFVKNQHLRNKVFGRDAHTKPRSKGHDNGQEFVDKLEQLYVGKLFTGGKRTLVYPKIVREAIRERFKDDQASGAYDSQYEGEFDSEEEVIFRQQALECLYTHQRLEDVLMNLNLDKFTDSSSAYDVLRKKQMAEFVLSTLSMYTEDASLLSKVQFEALPLVTEPVVSTAHQSHCWLLHECESHSLPGTKVQYSNLQDLQHYTGLLLKLQTMRCQQQLLHILTTDVLPWICSMDIQQEDFSATFRGIYALLVSDGDHLPAFIQDCLE